MLRSKVLRMSCCPSGSWPELKLDYKAQGVVEDLGDGLNVYSVGKGKSKCIIWNYDIFGFDAGRTRQLCDLFASEGYFVVLPDWYRGDWKNPFGTPPEELVAFVSKVTNWTGYLEPDLKNKVLPFAKKNGAEVFGSIGTCWGSYPVVRMSAMDEFKCGVSMHPSHTPLIPMLKEDESEILKAIKCPQMFMPAGNDAETCKPGGLAEQILKENLSIVEFPDMVHGWTTKGEFDKPNVERDVTKAVSEALGFFKKHL